nr:MAG: hypothetical protein DIU58_12345 [Sphaerobacter thermophilus]
MDKKKSDSSPQGEGAPAAPPELLTPAEWAERLGLIRKGNPLVPQVPTHADWRHAVADQLHGWSAHAYHHQSKPFRISREDYDAALLAAAAYPCCPPHPAALPESQRQRFAGFKARKRTKEVA